MAYIRKRGATYRVEIYIDGTRESASFPTKRQAAAWALQREAGAAGKQLPSNTVGDALRRYADDVAPRRRGARWEILRCALIGRGELASVPLPVLDATHIARWRDQRLEQVSGSSVRREMTLLAAVFGKCRKEWGWLQSDPMAGVDKPPEPPPRRRRISPDEIERVTMALGYDGGPPETASHRVALAFHFALETAMRSGEILGLTWADVGAKSLTLPATKNGDMRRVPLSLRAREILALLPRDTATCFALDGAVRDTLWRRARDAAHLVDLTFHDSRAEAIWRLSRKVDVLELARIIGHRDIRSLMFYYEIDADELADRLD